MSAKSLDQTSSASLTARWKVSILPTGPDPTLSLSPIGRQGRGAPVGAKEWGWERRTAKPPGEGVWSILNFIIDLCRARRRALNHRIGQIRNGNLLLHPPQLICFRDRADSFFEEKPEKRCSSGVGERRPNQEINAREAATTGRSASTQLSRRSADPVAFRQALRRLCASCIPRNSDGRDRHHLDRARVVLDPDL